MPANRQTAEKNGFIWESWISADLGQAVRIPLSEGGCLFVNRNQLNELSRAISRFSAEDVGIIMRALWQDTHCTRKQKEIEELEDTAPVNADEARQNADTRDIYGDHNTKNPGAVTGDIEKESGEKY